MPKYVYGDNNGHHKELEMTWGEAQHALVLCEICDDVMHRVPQAVAVNWNGLPPHAADARPPIVKNFIDTAQERRARYLDTERNK